MILSNRYKAFCIIFFVLIHIFSYNLYAEDNVKNKKLAIQSQYSSTVSKYILNRNTVEKVEDGILLLIALYPDYDFTDAVAVKQDALNIYENKICKSIFSELPESADTMKILSEGGGQEDFILAVTEKIQYIYNNYSNIEDNNSLKYSSILYVENYTKKLVEISSVASEKLKEIYNTIKDENSDFVKIKKELESLDSTNLLITKVKENFINTQSGMGSEKLINTFLNKINGNYYFTSEMLIGKALSSTYVPLRDNIYDNPNIDLAASENYKAFNSKYGDLRKALYISTNNKAVSQYNVTGKLSSYKPAILRDFIENVDDEKLFITDTNYYNKSEIKNLQLPDNDNKIEIDKEDISNSERTDNNITLSEEKTSKNLTDNYIKVFFTSWFEDGFDIKQTTAHQTTALSSKSLNNIIQQEVINNLSDTGYAINKWFGIALALDIFKDSELVDMIAEFENKPVFRSSGNETGSSYPDAQLNWILLNNIKDSYPIRYDAVLDLDSPVFIDIYGNIVTESGLIIIPYAANPTLHKKIPILNIAFLSSYGKRKSIEVDDTVKAYAGKQVINLNEQSMNMLLDYPAFMGVKNQEILIPYKKNKTYILNPVTIITDVGSVDLSKIDTVSKSTASAIYNITLSMYTESISDKTYNIKSSVINVENDISNILYQVIRGAEIQDIDYTNEKLTQGINFNKGLLSQALKYERLVNQLTTVSQNSLVTVPDMTSIDVVKYGIFFIYRALIILFTIYSLLQIYISASTQKLGISTIFKIITAFSCIGVTVFSLPLIYKYSYYTVTKALLQKEASTITMLNEEKRNNNVELGVVTVKNAEISSKLSLKIKDLDIDYVDYLTGMIDAENINEMQDIYNREIEYSIETDIKDYDVRSGALYYDVDKLFASSQIYVDTDTNKLKQVVSGEPAISFRLPYYAILDYILENINNYNNILNSYDYSIQIMADGRIRSIGLTERYFNSNAFNLVRNEILENSEEYIEMDENIKNFALYDKSGIFSIYGLEGYDNRNIFGNRTSLKNSQWYADKLDGNEEVLSELSEALDNEAVEWINNHKNVIGRISDETILKALALDLSLKYNELLNVDGPQKIEIEYLSNEDIIRLCAADTERFLISYPYSYSKYILTTSGLAGIYISAIITLITFILGLLKPFVTILSFIIFIASLVILRVLFNKKTANIKGFIKFIVILIVINISYSFGLKFFMLFPEAVPSLVRLILFLIMQIVYTILYIWLTVVLIINWKDLGNNAFVNVLKMKTLDLKSISVKSIDSKNEEDENFGWNVYEMLQQSDEYRKDKTPKK